MKNSPRQSNDSLQRNEEIARRNQIQGKKLDDYCTGGRHGGTVFLPISKYISEEIERILNVTAYYIPTTSSSSQTKAELTNPTQIPILEYGKRSQESFWTYAEQYAKIHANNTNPRLFGMVRAQDLSHFQKKQKLAMQSMQSSEDFDPRMALDLPIFTVISKDKAEDVLQLPFFENITQGVTHGLIMQSPDHAKRANDLWHEYRNTLEIPQLHARPFLGLQMSTEELIKYMTKNTDIEVDTLVPTDMPNLDQAKRLRDMHMERMSARKDARTLDNPFRVEGREKNVSFAVINVQGSAREDAIALLKASKDIDEFNVDVHLVENGEQLNNVKPDVIVFPGGWHKIQFNHQAELGINTEVVQLEKEGVHMVNLCAGAILARTAARDDLIQGDAVRSDGCAPGTAFGIGEFGAINNLLSGPYNVLMKLHNSGDPDQKKSRIILDVPFSNGPTLINVNPDTMDIIARLSTDSRAEDVDDDDGEVVAVQVKRKNGVDPVRIAASFHDPSIYTYTLNELDNYYREARHNREKIGHSDEYYRREMGL